MQAITTYASVFVETLERRIRQMRGRAEIRAAAAAGAGFVLSASSLLGRAMPLALGLVCAAPPGFYAAAAALGGSIGYLLFWQETQGVAWMAAGLLAVSLAGNSQAARQQALLLPALAAVVASGCGLGFALLFGDETPVRVYLLRVAVSSAATACFRQWRAKPEVWAGWLVRGIITFSLAQIAPGKNLGLGYLAAGFFGVRSALPSAAMAGLGLDLAQVTKIPMTGVLCLGFILRVIPDGPKWLSALSGGIACCVLSLLEGRMDFRPLPGLVLGGIAGTLLPENSCSSQSLQRRGSVGVAQVRLERAALAMGQLEHSLLLAREPQMDLRSLLRRAQTDSCDTCPERKGCKVRGKITAVPTGILEQPGLQAGDLPAGCRKPSRLLSQLRLQQERLRTMKADRSRLRSYRTALGEQYRFLSDYLQELSDHLSSLHEQKPPRFRPEVGVSSRSLEETSGDQWACFSPEETTAYFLLCDGMGTGEGAAREAAEAIGLLRQMLEAGFTPGQALNCFNSLSALRFSGGSATVDLVKLDLAAGSATVYKWGAGVSYLLRAGQLKKIGTAGPPPGISQQARAWENRLSLGGEDVLILLSDGAGAEGLARPECPDTDLTAGELAESILEQGVQRGDDATVAVVKLIPLCPDTP